MKLFYITEKLKEFENHLCNDIINIIVDYLRETKQQQRLSFIWDYTTGFERTALLHTHMTRYKLNVIQTSNPKYEKYNRVLCMCGSSFNSGYYNIHIKSDIHKKKINEYKNYSNRQNLDVMYNFIPTDYPPSSDSESSTSDCEE